MTPANKTVEIIPGKGKNLFPEKLKDEFYYKAMILAKIMSENEYAAPVYLCNPREIFREYAQKHFKPEPQELAEARQLFDKVLQEVLDERDAGTLKTRCKRSLARIRSAKWRQRSWKRKGW